MLNPLGKELRKIRIDRDELMKDMAEKLGVSVSFLSAVETGRKPIPSGFASRITVLYGLSTKEFDDLRNAADMSLKNITVNLTDTNDGTKRIALALARGGAEGLTEDQINEILKVLEK